MIRKLLVCVHQIRMLLLHMIRASHAPAYEDPASDAPVAQAPGLHAIMGGQPL